MRKPPTETRLTQWLVLLSLLTLSACSWIVTPLSELDLNRWTQAYANLANVSPKLNAQMASAGTTDVLLCESCRATMSEAVTGAGFDDLPSFVLLDTRIRVAQLHLVHRQMTALLHEISTGLHDTEGCPASITDVQGDKPLALLCYVLAAKISSMESASKKVDLVTGVLTGDADVAFVEAHYAHIDRSSSDPRLIDGYRTGWPDDIMKSPARVKLQACRRIELGFGDRVDRTACPEGVPPKRIGS